MIIIFEGPEKAGKSTLIKTLADLLIINSYPVRLRKFTGAMTSEQQYLQPLHEDANDPDTISIWDRGWVSEYVYATYYHRNSTLRNNAPRAEKIFSPVVDLYGLKYMVLPEDVSELGRRRDSTDLSIEPEIEHAMFLQHARLYDWSIVPTLYTAENLITNCYGILVDIETIAEKYDHQKTYHR